MFKFTRFIAIALLCILVAVMASPITGAASSAPSGKKTNAAAQDEAQKAKGEAKGLTKVDLAPGARSAILMDADSGTVIYEKNKTEKLPPASITKIMTMLIVMEAIDQGKIKFTDKVRTSEYAASMGGSQIFLEAGEEMTVEDLLKGVAMASGNDASVALAEHVAGSESAFVEMMNDRAKELGMTNTNFVNVNGLPAEQHYTSAQDIAIMSRELLKHEEITKYTSAYQDYLRKETDNPFWLVNTNKLVRFYTGADGLKTGYTSEAKFCLAATAKRDNFRVIAVVLGEPNTKTRNAETSSLFDYAFAQYQSHTLIKNGDPIATINVEKGQMPKIDLVAKQQYSVLLKKGQKTNDIRYELKLDKELKAPIALGQPLGKLVAYKGDSVLKEFEIESPVSVGQASWWTIFKRTTSKLFFID